MQIPPVYTGARASLELHVPREALERAHRPREAIAFSLLSHQGQACSGSDTMVLVESAKGNEKQVQENSFQKTHFKKAAVGAWPGG